MRPPASKWHLGRPEGSTTYRQDPNGTQRLPSESIAADPPTPPTSGLKSHSCLPSDTLFVAERVPVLDWSARNFTPRGVGHPVTQIASARTMTNWRLLPAICSLSRLVNG